MFKFLILAANICAVFGLPVDQPLLKLDHPRERHPVTVVPIVSEEFSNKGDGTFRFGFVSGDGTKVEEEGVLKVYDEKTAEEVVHGGYEYVSPNGRSIKLRYFADGSGFHAFSDDIGRSADVAPLSDYDRYFNGKQQFQGSYKPQFAARSLSDATEKTVAPVVPLELSRHEQFVQLQPTPVNPFRL